MAMARDFLLRTRYNVDLAERIWRRHSAHMRARRQAAAAAAAPPPPLPAAQPPVNPLANSDAVVNDQTGQAPYGPDRDEGPPTPSTGNDDDQQQPGSGSEHGGQDPAPGSDSDEDDPEPPVAVDPELIAKMESSYLPFSSGDQEPRDAALAFREAIRERESARLSISEAVLLLFLAGGDIGVALTEFTSHSGARRRLRYNFDGLRELQEVEDQIQESKCLQILTEITRRNDWLSLKRELERRKWNMVKTVVRWFKKGIPVFEDADIPRDKPKDWGLRGDRWARKLEKPSEESTNPATSDLTGWAPDGADFTDPNDDDQPEPRIWGPQ